MIAYNNQWLYNMYVRRQADEALQEGCIAAETHEAIYNGKEVKFYTPNIFIRTGLAVLTLIVISFANSLLFVMFHADSSTGWGFLLFFTGAACYVVAELFIKNNAHYNSGVDNMLVWMAGGLLWCSFLASVWDMGDPKNVLSFAALAISAALAIRFADGLMSIVATIALLCFVFFCYQHMGAFAKATTPFVMMLLSAGIYFASAKTMGSRRLLLYQHCFHIVSVVALLALYAAGNYYLVRELSIAMFHLELRPQDLMPMGWFFWVWTFLLPLIYIGAGIRKKNITLVRTGIPLIAASIFTFRYYHSILAPEMAMLIGGVALFIVSYSLINYLREPKGGFTFKPDSDASDTPDAGRMITGEIMSRSAHAPDIEDDSEW